jgi:galactose mutarotase-like enzyme
MAEQFQVRGWPVIRLASASLTVDVVPEYGGTVTSIRRTADDLE